MPDTPPSKPHGLDTGGPAEPESSRDAPSSPQSAKPAVSSPVFAGPVESILTQPMLGLDGGSRLYGWIWTTERGVVLRYYRAQMRGGEVFPICAVARRGGEELAGKPGKYPKSVELQSSSSAAFIVEDFI